MSASPGRGAAHVLRGLRGLAGQRRTPGSPLAAVALRDYKLRGPLGGHKWIGAGVRSRNGALALRHAPRRALWEDRTAAGGMLWNGAYLVRGALSSGWIAEINDDSLLYLHIFYRISYIKAISEKLMSQQMAEIFSYLFELCIEINSALPEPIRKWQVLHEQQQTIRANSNKWERMHSPILLRVWHGVVSPHGEGWRGAAGRYGRRRPLALLTQGGPLGELARRNKGWWWVPRGRSWTLRRLHLLGWRWLTRCGAFTYIALWGLPPHPRLLWRRPLFRLLLLASGCFNISRRGVQLLGVGWPTCRLLKDLLFLLLTCGQIWEYAQHGVANLFSLKIYTQISVYKHYIGIRKIKYLILRKCGILLHFLLYKIFKYIIFTREDLSNNFTFYWKWTIHILDA